MSQTQLTAGLRLRPYLDPVDQNRERIAKIPTSQVPVIVPPAESIIRPWLKVVNPDSDTISLVGEAIDRFHRSYPTCHVEIVLGKALRYLEMWVAHSPLNYRLEIGDFDVMVRSV